MADRFGIRGFSRNGNAITFILSALNADGTVDTGFTGQVTWQATSFASPGVYTFVPGDQGAHSFTVTITDPAQNATLIAQFAANAANGAVLTVAGPSGSTVDTPLGGDSFFVGGSGVDTFFGGSGSDFFRLDTGGIDTVQGRDGDDAFYFGSAYTSGDVVSGGAGTLDQIGLQGNYSLGVSFGSILGIEQVVLLPGDDTRFGDALNLSYSYSLTADADTRVSNNALTIQANTLRAGEDFTFNGAATAIDFLLYGGGGADFLTGGSGSDAFYFGYGLWGASDRVVGGAGALDQLGLQGIYTITFGAAQMVGIEYLALLSGGDTRFGSGGRPYSYALTMNDGNVAAGASLAVSANTLRVDETLTFNGAAEANGTFRIFGGLGADTITGGAGADEIVGGGGNDRITGGLGGDILFGGEGNDTFVYSTIQQSQGANIDQIRDFASGDIIDLFAVDSNTRDCPGNNAFIFIGSGNFVQFTAGLLRATNVGTLWTVEGDTNGDGAADFTIYVTVTDTNTQITAASFIL